MQHHFSYYSAPNLCQGHDDHVHKSLKTVCSTVYSGADERNNQNSESLAFERRILRCQVNSPHKGPVTRKMLRFDDVIMPLMSVKLRYLTLQYHIVRRVPLFKQSYHRPTVENRSTMRSRPLTIPRQNLLITGSALPLHRTIVVKGY